MEPLETLPQALSERVAIVLFDIDDTFTLNGRIPAPAFDALERLHTAGIFTAPVTGRPAGWCDHIARMWPVDAVVGENGAFYFRYDLTARRMMRRYWEDEGTRRAHRAQLDAIARAVTTEVPGTRVASDQHYRESDLAIDFCEDVPALSREAVDEIHAIFKRWGAVSKTSSIHINGWFGHHDKRSMAELMLSEILDISSSTAGRRAVFVGDSPNDCPMFERFPHSVGVANIRAFAGELSAAPHWVTEREGGLGFTDFANHLLAGRTRNSAWGISD